MNNMQQKTKTIIFAILALIIVAGGAYLILTRFPVVQQSAQTGETATSTKPVVTREISGKIRSFNAKAIYIELADGKGFAVGIKPGTPVMTQGVAKPGSLVDIKFGQNITATVDENDNATQILIKK
jgi:hypothetical protein